MRLFFLALCCTAFAVVGNSQDVPKDSIIRKLRLIRQAINSRQSPSNELMKLVGHCSANINNALLLLNNYKGGYPGSFNEAMSGLLTFSLQIHSLDTIDQKKALSALCADLRLKFKERESQLSTVLYTQPVRVQVITLKRGQPVKNLRVRYAALGFKIDYSRPTQNFQRLCGPCSDDIIPGFYEIWVTEDGQFEVLQRWTGEIDPAKQNVIELNLE